MTNTALHDEQQQVQQQSNMTTAKQELLKQRQSKVIDDLSSTDDDDDDDNSFGFVRAISVRKIIGIDIDDEDADDNNKDDDNNDEENNKAVVNKGIACDTESEMADSMEKVPKRNDSKRQRFCYWIKAISISLLIAIAVGATLGLFTMFIADRRHTKGLRASSETVQLPENDVDVVSQPINNDTSTIDAGVLNNKPNSTTILSLIDMNKTSWPELMNMDLQIAISVIQSQRPDITIIYVISDGGGEPTVTSSSSWDSHDTYHQAKYEPDYEITYQANRVRIHVNDNGYISQIPTIG
jgi:Potato inhibitor I family